MSLLGLPPRTSNKKPRRAPGRFSGRSRLACFKLEPLRTVLTERHSEPRQRTAHGGPTPGFERCSGARHSVWRWHFSSSRRHRRSTGPQVAWAGGPTPRTGDPSVNPRFGCKRPQIPVRQIVRPNGERDNGTDWRVPFAAGLFGRGVHSVRDRRNWQKPACSS